MAGIAKCFDGYGLCVPADTISLVRSGELRGRTYINQDLAIRSGNAGRPYSREFSPGPLRRRVDYLKFESGDVYTVGLWGANHSSHCNKRFFKKQLVLQHVPPGMIKESGIDSIHQNDQSLSESDSRPIDNSAFPIGIV